METDVCTSWTEAVPLLTREQSLVVAGLEAIAAQLPFPVRGINSDNDSVFINDTLTEYCSVGGIEFTRSRAYRKNDQAWVEQKNGAVIRRFLGHERYSGQVAGQTIAHLHRAVRLYVNYFQPSFKLVEKTRNGSTVIKRYSSPATPCDLVLGHDAVSIVAKTTLSECRATLDPVVLLHTIREAQAAWHPWCSRHSGQILALRAWSAFWPGYPIGAWRNRIVPDGNRESARREHGGPGRTRSRECGARCWAGWRKTRTRALWLCWSGCKKLSRGVSAESTCGRCNGGCRNGEASWPASWSTQVLDPLRETLGTFRN